MKVYAIKSTPLNDFIVKRTTPDFFSIQNATQIEKSSNSDKKQTTGQMWANILHEVSREEDERERNKYLKVRKLEKTLDKTSLNSDFSISGLKPENK